MDESTMIFLLMMVAISTVGWVINNFIRARHGFEPLDRHGLFGGRRNRVRYWGRAVSGQDEDEVASTRKIELLSNENQRLTGQVSRLEERIAVLERIATDPAERTAREIDALR